MPTPVAIPDRVRQLILESINSVAELEALLLLRETVPRAWTSEEASARLYVSPTVATYSLNSLTEKGLLEVIENNYIYSPASVDLDQDVKALAEAYSTSLIAVTQLIHSKPGSSVQDFARAFRWRKDP